jgi:predicted RecA/RadA family phage recombinase
MSIEAVTHHGPGEVKAVTSAALVNGQLVQLPDSRAGVYTGLKAAEAGEYVTLSCGGVREVLKTASVAILAGQEVWAKISTSRATYRLAGDYFVGVAVADAAASATTVKVDMNARPNYNINLAENGGQWTTEATNGLGATALLGGGVSLAFDAVAEVAQAALLSDRTFDVDDGLIYEVEAAVFDIGNNAALDIDFGLASASHGTDLGAVTALATIHLDGNDLSATTQSDDNVTDVAPDDTGVDLVDDAWTFLQVDARDKDDVKFYINGVRVNDDGAHVLAAYTSTVVAIAHMEKTSDDTSAEVRVRRMTVRSRAAA